MIKAIVFDFDGVIVDSEPLHYRAFLQTAQSQGVPVDFDYDEYLRKYVGYDDRDGFRAMIESVDTRAVAAADFPTKLKHLCDRKEHVFKEIVDAGFETIPGVLDFIAGLPRDLPIAIASGATRADIELILGKLGIKPRFSAIVTASDVARSKPDPQTYRAAFAGLQKKFNDGDLQPKHVVAIEDTAAGIESARGAGLHTLGLTTTTDGSGLGRASRVIKSLVGLNLEQVQKWFG